MPHGIARFFCITAKRAPAVQILFKFRGTGALQFPAGAPSFIYYAFLSSRSSFVPASMMRSAIPALKMELLAS